MPNGGSASPGPKNGAPLFRCNPTRLKLRTQALAGPASVTVPSTEVPCFLVTVPPALFGP